jgi:hypothetical protein
MVEDSRRTVRVDPPLTKATRGEAKTMPKRQPKPKRAVPSRKQPGPTAELRAALTRRKKAELVDVLVELAEADRGDLAVEMSEAFPLFLEECWKDFRGPCILTLVGRNKGAGS